MSLWIRSTLAHWHTTALPHSLSQVGLHTFSCCWCSSPTCIWLPFSVRRCPWYPSLCIPLSWPSQWEINLPPMDSAAGGTYRLSAVCSCHDRNWQLLCGFLGWSSSLTSSVALSFRNYLDDDSDISVPILILDKFTRYIAYSFTILSLLSLLNLLMLQSSFSPWQMIFFSVHGVAGLIAFPGGQMHTKDLCPHSQPCTARTCTRVSSSSVFMVLLILSHFHVVWCLPRIFQYTFTTMYSSCVACLMHWLVLLVLCIEFCSICKV